MTDQERHNMVTDAAYQLENALHRLDLAGEILAQQAEDRGAQLAVVGRRQTPPR